MNRTLLALVVLTLPADAAPQLRPKPGTEEARIEALRAKYDQIRKSGPDRLADQVDLKRAEAKLPVILQGLDDLARLPVVSPVADEWIQKRRREIRANSVLEDLYAIA